jgi:hypothetical protein
MGEALDPQPVPQPSNEEIWRELRDLNSRLAGRPAAPAISSNAVIQP